MTMAEKREEEHVGAGPLECVELMVGRMKHFASHHFCSFNEVKQGAQLKLKGSRQ